MGGWPLFCMAAQAVAGTHKTTTNFRFMLPHHRPPLSWQVRAGARESFLAQCRVELQHGLATRTRHLPVLVVMCHGCSLMEKSVFNHAFVQLPSFSHNSRLTLMFHAEEFGDSKFF